MPYVSFLKRNDTNVLTYRTERDSQTEKTNLRLPRWRGQEAGGIVRAFGMVLYALLYLPRLFRNSALRGKLASLPAQLLWPPDCICIGRR